MAFKNSTSNNTEKAETKVTKLAYTISRVKEVNDTMVSFNINVNGVTIYGMKVIKYKSKKTGEEGMMVAFPTRKGSDDKYYNLCTFSMTQEMQDDIINQVLDQL